MSFVIVNPDVVAAAATDLANIGATISDANAAAAALTTEFVPAAGDEISAAIAGLFGTYAQDYHALAAQAAAFHARFMQAVNASAGSYLAAESAGATALFQTAQQDLLTVMNAPTEALLGHPLIGTGTGTPTAASAAVEVSAAGAVPENAYPFGGVKQLTFTESVSIGLQNLDNTLQPYIAAGTPVNIYGYSQSAVIASLEMAKLQAAGVPTSEASFLIVGDPVNPNGGFYTRFPGLQLPSLGMDFYGATPSNAYPTTIYTIQYDSWADFPQYPLNFLSDLNAIMSLNHFGYHALTPAQLDSAIQLPTSGPTMTTYYMIPATDLPLVAPLRGIPIIGNPIADLLQPDLTLSGEPGLRRPAIWLVNRAGQCAYAGRAIAAPQCLRTAARAVGKRNSAGHPGLPRRSERYRAAPGNAAVARFADLTAKSVVGDGERDERVDRPGDGFVDRPGDGVVGPCS